MEIWDSGVFGGCVLNKIGRKDGGTVTNKLKSIVEDYTLEYMYGGGYYKIENLPDPENN